jgi:hypothetical protein
VLENRFRLLSAFATLCDFVILHLLHSTLCSASRYRRLASSSSSVFILCLHYPCPTLSAFPTHVSVSSHRCEYCRTVANIVAWSLAFDISCVLFLYLGEDSRGLALFIVLHYCMVTSCITISSEVDDPKTMVDMLERLISGRKGLMGPEMTVGVKGVKDAESAVTVMVEVAVMVVPLCAGQ